MQIYTPQAVLLNGETCSLALASNISASSISKAGNATAPAPSTTALSAEQSSFLSQSTGHVSISGTQLLDVNGNPIILKGVSWFGFETQVRC
jgi:hypothetical protein